MSNGICPNCGAQTTKNVCEYCGEKISIFGSNSQGESSLVKVDIKNIRVAPFKIDRNGAAKVCHNYLSSILGGALETFKLTDITYRAIFIPITLFTKFDKLVNHQFCCSIDELPSIFSTIRFPRQLYKSISLRQFEYLSKQDDKDCELNSAETVMTPMSSVYAPHGIDEFTKYAFTAYLPFWVIDGKTNKGETLYMYIYAGVRYTEVHHLRKIACKVYSIDGEEVDLTLVKKAYDAEMSRKREAQQARKREEQQLLLREKSEIVKKRNRKDIIKLSLCIVIAVIGGFVAQYLLDGDLATSITFGIVATLGIGLMLFFVMISFSKD